MKKKIYFQPDAEAILLYVRDIILASPHGDVGGDDTDWGTDPLDNPTEPISGGDGYNG